MQKNSLFLELREYNRIKNEQLTPRRKQFQRVHCVIFIIWTVLMVVGAAVCCIIDFAKLWWIGLLCVLGIVSGVLVFLNIKSKVEYYEAVDELERLSYLFKAAELSPDDLLEVEGLEEDGVDFVLSKDGVRVKLREGGQQVFGDGMDDGKFYAWDELDLFVASSNEFCRVNLGLAIMSKQPTGFVDDEVVEDDEVFYILPMCKNLSLALHAFCYEKLELDWLYIFYQPLDAFLQIIKKGRIDKFLDRESGEELTEEFCEASSNKRNNE